MNADSATLPIERRMRLDRRVHSTTWWSALRLRGRRRGYRRAGEGHRGFVDCPSPYVTALVLWVTVSSALDAVLTLLYIARGGGEANPVMALALTHGNMQFMVLKMGLTCIGTWALSVLQRFSLAYIVLHIVLLIYLVIMGMHVAILLS